MAVGEPAVKSSRCIVPYIYHKNPTIHVGKYTVRPMDPSWDIKNQPSHYWVEPSAEALQTRLGERESCVVGAEAPFWGSVWRVFFGEPPKGCLIW